MASLDVSAPTAAAATNVDAGRMAFSRGQIENWGDSAMVVSSPRTDTSTDVEIEDRTKMVGILPSCFTLLRLTLYVYGILCCCSTVWWCSARCYYLCGFFCNVKGESRGAKGVLNVKLNLFVLLGLC